MEGLFIVFEGCEGVGKSTQAKLLYEFLKEKKLDVIYTKEPYSGNKPSAIIKDLLLSERYSIPKETELFLFLANRNIHFKEKILPALRSKKIVICERFHLSTLAYQSFGLGLDFEFVKKTSFFSAPIRPHITFLLYKQDIEKERKDKIEKRDDIFFKKVKEAYIKFAKGDKTVFLINTKDLTPTQTHDIIKKRVLEYVRELSLT